MSGFSGQDARAGADHLTRRFRTIRLVSVLVSALSVAGLSLMAVAAGGTKTTHTTVVKKVEDAAPAAAHRKVPAHPGATATTVPAATPALVAPAPLTAAALVAPTVAQVVTAASVAPPSTAAPVAPSTPAPTSGGTAPTAAALPACPISLPTPTQTGGLQSLIALAPLFGPFSSEAFASAAAVQPVLSLFGPFLVQFAALSATAEPSLAPLVSQVEALENEGYSVLSPYYAPYRAQFLSAETALATALAPYAQQLASNPAAGCLVDIEGALAETSSS